MRFCFKMYRRQLVFLLFITFCCICAYLRWHSPSSLSITTVKYPAAKKVNELKISPPNKTLQQQRPKSRLLQRCKKPVRHFVYVKTHKTGSTTVRAAVKRHKTTNSISLLDCGRGTPFCGGYPGRFVKKFEMSSSFEAISHHLRFNPEGMASYMPEQTKYFTIIREPWSHFQSCINFYKTNMKNLKANCHDFPHMYLTNGSEISIGEFVVRANSLLNKSVPWYFRLKNYQAHDLGLDPMLSNDAKINEEIKKLEAQLDLVMIMEYMDESLILLKDLLCTNWEMIPALNQNVRNYEKYSMDDITSNEQKEFMNLEKLDVALYRHFNASFWKKVDEYGRERMNNDLKKLRSLRKISSRTRKRSKQVTAFKEYDRLSKHELVMLLKGYTKYSRQVADYMINNSGSCYRYTDKPLIIS